MKHKTRNGKSRMRRNAHPRSERLCEKDRKETSTVKRRPCPCRKGTFVSLCDFSTLLACLQTSLEILS